MRVDSGIKKSSEFYRYLMMSSREKVSTYLCRTVNLRAVMREVIEGLLSAYRLQLQTKTTFMKTH